MKKVLFLIYLFSSTVLGVQYIGDNKLCIVDNENNRTCLEQYDNYSLDSDCIISLHEPEFKLNIDIFSKLWGWIYSVGVLLLLLMVVFKIIQYM